MKTIPFPQFLGKDNVPFSSKVDCQILMCLYRETIDSRDGEFDYWLSKTPGLQSVLTSPNGRHRGGFQLNDHLFQVIGNALVEILPDLVLPASYFGPIADDGKNCTFAADPDTLVFVSAGVLYAIYQGALSAPSTPFAPLAVVFIDGYFFALSVFNQLFFSKTDGFGSIAGLTWDPLDFQTLEASANNIITIIVDHNELWAIGNRISQVLTVGTDANTPLVPRQDAIIPQGTVAGSSVCAVNDVLMFVGRNKNGQGTVVQMNGYQPQPIATYSVINKMRTFATLDDCIAMPFQMNGHEHVWFTFPTAGRTLCYDATEKDWYEVGWWNESLGWWERHRANCIVSAFDKILVGDHSNGKLYELSPDFYDDDGGTLRWMRRTPHLTKNNRKLTISRFEVTAETGVGLDAPPIVQPGVPALNLEVVLEMGARTWSSGGSYQFEPNSSLINLNPADYDGAVYYFETSASNTHATIDYTVELMQGATSLGTVTIPANTGVIRLRSTAFSPAVSNSPYHLRLAQTAVGGQLCVHSGRIVVVQTNATKTRLQFSLGMLGGVNPTATDASASFMGSDGVTYDQGSPDGCYLLPLDLSQFADIADGNPWTWETVGIIDVGSAYAGLFDATLNAQIGTIENTHSGLLTTSLQSVDFPHSVIAGSNGNNLEVRLKSGTANIALHSANLYVRLTNLTKALIYRRVAYPRTVSSGDNGTSQGDVRQPVDAALYSNAAVFFEATGRESSAGTVTDGLADFGTADVAGSPSLVAGSSLAFNSSSKIVQRSAAVAITAGDRFGEIAARSSGAMVLAGEYLVVSAYAPITDIVLGPGLGLDPQMVLRVSWDSGNSFSNSYSRSMGKLGEVDKQIEWNRLGTGRNPVIEVTGSDPVKTVLTGANLDIELLNS